MHPLALKFSRPQARRCVFLFEFYHEADDHARAFRVIRVSQSTFSNRTSTAIVYFEGHATHCDLPARPGAPRDILKTKNFLNVLSNPKEKFLERSDLGFRPTSASRTGGFYICRPWRLWRSLCWVATRCLWVVVCKIQWYSCVRLINFRPIN